MRKNYSTKSMNGYIGGLVAQMRLTSDQKQGLIFSFSDGRTTTTPELYFDEARELITYLKGVLGIGETSKDRMTNKILSLAHEMNWRIRGRIDIARVNNWCVKYGHCHKPLDDHTEQELPKLVTQFEKAHLDYLRGI